MTSSLQKITQFRLHSAAEKCKRVKKAGSEQEDAVLLDAVPVRAPDKTNFGGIRTEVFFEIPQKGRQQKKKKTKRILWSFHLIQMIYIRPQNICLCGEIRKVQICTPNISCYLELLNCQLIGSLSQCSIIGMGVILGSLAWRCIIKVLELRCAYRKVEHSHIQCIVYCTNYIKFYLYITHSIVHQIIAHSSVYFLFYSQSIIRY